MAPRLQLFVSRFFGALVRVVLVVRSVVGVGFWLVFCFCAIDSRWESFTQTDSE